MKIKHILKTIGLISAYSLSTFLFIACDDDDNSSNVSEEENFTIPQSLEGVIIDFTVQTSSDAQEVGDVFTFGFQNGLAFTNNEFIVDPFADLDNVDSNPDQFTYQIIENNVARLQFFFVEENGSLDSDGDVTLSFTSPTTGTFVAFQDEDEDTTGSFQIR